MFVSFGDIDNPRTVETANPHDLASRFGAGVRLRGVIVQITDDPVTSGIEKRLSWLRQLALEGRHLNGSNSVAIQNNDLANSLGPGSFSTEILR
jgi:hypothetical protein